MGFVTQRAATTRTPTTPTTPCALCGHGFTVALRRALRCGPIYHCYCAVLLSICASSRFRASVVKSAAAWFIVCRRSIVFLLPLPATAAVDWFNASRPRIRFAVAGRSCRGHWIDHWLGDWVRAPERFAHRDFPPWAAGRHANGRNFSPT